MSIAATEKYGELGAADATLALPVGGYGTIGIQLSGTWVGTVTFEATIDTGTWQSINVVKTNSTTQVTTATGNGIWFGACAGLRVVRARMSAYTSGTAQVQLLAAGTGGGSGSGGGGGGGGGTSSDFGAAFPAAGTATGFTDGTDMQPALVDAQGHLQVDVLSGGGGSSPFGDPMPADGVPIGFQDSGGDLAPVVLEADGSIPVTVVSGGGSNASVGTIDAAAPTSATQTGFTDASSGELRAWTSENLDYDTGAGSAPQTIVGIALPSSGGPVAGGTSSNPLRVDPTGSTTQPVSGTVTANQGGAPWSVQTSAQVPGTGATNLGKAEDAVAGAGDTGVFSLSVANEAQSTLAADGDYIARAADTKGNTLVAGNLAHDAVDAGNPQKIGMKAVDYGATPSAVAAADRTNLYADRAGVPFVIGGHPDVVTIEAEYTAAQTDTAIVTVSSGTAIVVTQIQALCDEANTVGVGFRVGFAATNTPTTTGVVLTHPGLVPGSGVSRGDGGAILGVGASGEDLRITSEVPTGGSLRILVTYYTVAI